MGYIFYGKKLLSHFYVLIIRDASHKNPDIWNLAAESYYSLPAIVTWDSVTTAPTDMACVSGLLVTSLIPLETTPTLAPPDRLYFGLSIESDLLGPKNALSLSQVSLQQPLSLSPLSFTSHSSLRALRSSLFPFHFNEPTLAKINDLTSPNPQDTAVVPNSLCCTGQSQILHPSGTLMSFSSLSLPSSLHCHPGFHPWPTAKEDSSHACGSPQPTGQ